MVELVEYIARNLVQNSDKVVVRQEEDDDGVRTLLLSVDESDMGRVIGKHGRIAKAIRAIVKAASIRAGVPCSVEIVDTEEAN